MQDAFLVNNGKTTTWEWHEFEVSFKYAWYQVKNVSQEETKRLIIQKIPGFILKWVAEEEERRTCD